MIAINSNTPTISTGSRYSVYIPWPMLNVFPTVSALFTACCGALITA